MTAASVLREETALAPARLEVAAMGEPHAVSCGIFGVFLLLCEGDE